MLSVLAISLLLQTVVAGAGRNVTVPSQCSCGYRDPSTKEHYTDAIILYFNETALDTEIFDIRDCANKNQKGWNSIFRQGSSPSNIHIGNNGSLPWQDVIDGTSPSLEMWLDGFEFSHLSNGAEIRSLRRDILFGSFRASMRSAQPWIGGSAMSMYLQYNDSQSINMDMCNMDIADQAHITQLVNGEWPEYKLATNYTIIQKGDPPKIPAGQPWDFQDLRFDWTNDTVSFWIGNNRTRTVTQLQRDLPAVPETLYFSHWSTGDSHYMQGPPINNSVANVRWIRAFFNSSLMTPHDHVNYDRQCNPTVACSTEDMSLRGSSSFSPAATAAWKPPVPHQRIRTVAGYIAAGFSFFGVFALVNAFIRRGPLYKFKRLRDVSWPGSKRSSTQKLRQSLRQSIIGANNANNYPGPPDGKPPNGQGTTHSGTETPAPGYTSRPNGRRSGYNSGTVTPLPAYESRMQSPWQLMYSLVQPKRSLRSLSGRNTPLHSRNAWTSIRPMASQGTIIEDALTPPLEHPPALRVTNPSEEDEDLEVEAARTRAYFDLAGEKKDEDEIRNASPVPTHGSPEGMRIAGEKKHASVSFMDLDDKSDEKHHRFEVPTAPQDKSALDMMKVKPVPDGMAGAATAEPAKEQKPQAPNQPQQRIDYLAGLVAISCIMITLRHFSLTFWPYVTESQGLLMHFGADQWLSYILGPYLLTPLWIGPFFVTSCRFLAQRYLKTGKLNDVANKMLLRAPRMLLPCFVFMTLEYFLISLGLTKKLEWLPSISYSTWPYVVAQPNFGVFVNEIVELAYIIPNEAPEIINHYCVGVLWTIPIQLQYSFVTLLATVLIKDVKTPWKRMLFYTLSILADITYNWIKWTQARWWALYPILFLATGITIATPLVLLFNSDIYYWSFMAWENAIHPNQYTGRPIFETIPSIWAAYPNYNYPSLAILTFSVGLQVIVELSTWVQKALSIKLITFFHPHIMTIYLMHGFIFWSIGAYVAVSLSSLSIPYWAILLITAVVCYSIIMILTVIITPMIEFATKGATKNIWRWATEEPVPHRPTTAPFNKQLVVGRMQDENGDRGSEEAA
ncbi:glycoside hydrolase family 16 protein [Zasmidium cellare ATCC 36951]|uniref:Glycoside hydrolase family 16 protein n=1 Tax=Zasmidium cellare ATCC 36951 TaxID=1080233 RepID=A0A6A6CCN2_ZASCE|nr:glycoside hydrolase family 16 protein [Zasmidium cellare ATCC 36951]KAF2164801.1 glycoside hydrolase family 16 protein [Zasmidium cellare ATCC 36951]